MTAKVIRNNSNKMNINLKIPTLFTLINIVYAGFLHTPLEYSTQFAASPYLPYELPSQGQFAAPLPVELGDTISTYPHQPLPVAPLPVTPQPVAPVAAIAPISVNTYETSTSHHTYAAPPPQFVKYQLGFRSLKPRFRLVSGPIGASVYSGHVPYGISPPQFAYNGLAGQNGIIKYGPPITTTTTTYSTSGVRGVSPFAAPYGAPYSGRVGW